MWKRVLEFEIRYHLKQPLFYISAVVFFLLALGLVSTPASDLFSKAPGTVYRNAPVEIIRNLTIFSLLSLFLIPAFVTSSVLRDFESGTHALFFTKPIEKFDYLFGRFTGSMMVAAAVLAVAALGMVAGSLVPWQDADRIGPFSPTPYVMGSLFLVFPNLLIMGAVIFAVAIWSRRHLVSYLFVVFFVFAQDVVEEMAASFENVALGSLLEPTGLAALEAAVRYWTIAEYNSALPQLSGMLLNNRLAWLAVGLLFLCLGYLRFSYLRAASGHRSSRPGTTTTEPSPPSRDTPQLQSVRQAPVFSFVTHWRQFIRQTRLEVSLLLRSAPFIVLVTVGLLFVFSFAPTIGQNRGTPVYPVTHLMILAIRVGLGTVLAVIMILYSGELVWRERSLKLAAVYDALPVPNWVYLGAKMTALVCAIAAFIGSGAAATVAVQLSTGYTNLQPGLYARGLLVIGYPFVLLASIAVLLQVSSRNKFVGFLLTLVTVICIRSSPALGIEHNLLRLAQLGPMPYSDLSGFGPYAKPFLWFGLYWGLGCTMLLMVAALFWPRGPENPIKVRLGAVKLGWRGPVAACFALAATGFAATGGYIYYNTNVINDYLPRHQRLRQMAEYERQYRQYRDLPLPHITAVRADVDMYPREQRVEIHGSYTLVNKGTEAIEVLPISIGHRWDPNGYLPFGGQVILDSIQLPGHRVRLADEELGFWLLELVEPLVPGAKRDLGFDVLAVSPGFKHARPDNRIVENGTFFANKNFFPSLGYERSQELQNSAQRQRHDLPPLERAARADDLAARDRNYLDADWVTYETTVSTVAGQTAIGPGSLISDWIEGDRRYFRYRADAPILNLAAFFSADYRVARDSWNDVAIEIYHHPAHTWNVDRMITASKKSLEYFTTSFGPYPHDHLRIVEVPNDFGLTAASLAGTIAFSESWGFIRRVRRRDIDVVTAVIAHEVAHQWWNHQLIGGDVQGATLIAEGLSEYSALMVMEREFGSAKMHRYLQFELDSYLASRVREQTVEMPLLYVENQPYIHYNKGSLVLYALKDYVGEDAINGALRRFLDANAFQQPPYTTSLELVGYLREVVPAEFEYLIEDMFETITIFDISIDDATFYVQEDGTYRVTVRVHGRKLRSDGRGFESEVPISDWIDIGVFGEREPGVGDLGKVLFLEKRRVTETNTTFDIIVEGRPTRVGIDPYNKLIDRNPKDNVKRASERASPGRVGDLPGTNAPGGI